jgi:hypothetical protein
LEDVVPKIQCRTLAIYFLIFWLIFEGMGCSVWMAWNGKQGIDPKVDLLPDNLVGLSQQEVEAKFGRPSISEPLAEGKMAVTYKYGVFKRPDRGRAVAWLFLDAFSLGFGELLLTPLEYKWEKELGESGEVTITYGADYRVEKIGGY